MPASLFHFLSLYIYIYICVVCCVCVCVCVYACGNTVYIWNVPQMCISIFIVHCTIFIVFSLQLRVTPASESAATQDCSQEHCVCVCVSLCSCVCVYVCMCVCVCVSLCLCVWRTF